MCFYDGMNDVDKAGLQYVFPACVLILTIVLCRAAAVFSDIQHPPLGPVFIEFLSS